MSEYFLVSQQLGRRIADLRKRVGLSQSELGRRLNLSQAAISNIENAGWHNRGRGVKVTELGQLARELGVTVEDLIGGVGYTAEPVRIQGARAEARAAPRPGAVG